MKQGTSHRMHIAQSTDWTDAVITLLEPRSPYRPWRYGTTQAQAGDTVACVLNTDPPSMLADLARVETTDHPRTADFERPLRQPNLVELSTLARLLDLESWAADGWHFDGDDAVKLELALDERRYGCAPESRFGHNSMAAARTLLRFDGQCDGCGQRIGLTRPDARDQLFVHTTDPYVELQPESARTEAGDWPAVLCRRCRNRMDDEGYTSFVAFKFAMHPPCPKCGERRTRATFYGMPADHRNIPPWSQAGGCCPSPEKWCCGSCCHDW
ncbi:MAG TPA: hypothetical protein VET27_20030 [Mycobacterium sp.]|nr:hypothetical protein [Mycobacterium sp.]